MLARTDALMSQAETGKIALRPSSPLRPVVTRSVPDDNGVERIWFFEMCGRQHFSLATAPRSDRFRHQALLKRAHATARVHHRCDRGCGMAACGGRAATPDARYWISQH